MTTNNLKQCPFCKRVPALKHINNGSEVVCACGKTTGVHTAYQDNDAAVIGMWNEGFGSAMMAHDLAAKLLKMPNFPVEGVEVGQGSNERGNDYLHDVEQGEETIKLTF